MLGIIVRTGLFLSSYVPLFAIAATLNWTDHPRWSIAFVAVGVLGLLSLVAMALWARGVASTEMRVARVNKKDAEALAYIVTYIIPFIDVDVGDLTRAISVGILLLTLGIIYVSSDMIHVNPMLSILGWRVYEIETASGQTQTFIARGRRPTTGEKLNVVTLADDIHLVKKQ